MILCESQFAQLIPYLLSSHQIGYQSHLAWRSRNIISSCNCFHGNYLFPLSFLAICPLKFLVGANSPNLCPTMLSVTKTGMNLFPLCTANVWPTKSGEIIDRLDQVLMTDFFPDSFIASTFTTKWCSI